MRRHSFKNIRLQATLRRLRNDFLGSECATGMTKAIPSLFTQKKDGSKKPPFFHILLSQIRNLFDTGTTEELSLIGTHTIRISAENAGRLVLFQNDAIVIDKDLDGIALIVDVHILT
jgi:hypothetical protein